MKNRNRKSKFKLRIGDIKIEHKDDTIASYQLIKIILLALKLAEIEDKDEIERIQKDFITD